MSITGINLMASSFTNQVESLRSQQQTSDDATKRLNGTLDPYSMNATTASIGLDAEAQIAKFTQESRICQQVLLGQNKINSQISQANSINDDLRTYLFSLRTGIAQTSLGTISTRISDISNSFISSLNESFAGTYPLGGDKNQEACVDVSIAQSPLNAGSPVVYDYYVGGTTEGKITLGGIPIKQFAVAANDPAFATTLTALRLMSNPALTNDPNDPLLLSAIDTLSASGSLYGNAISASATNIRNVKNASDKLVVMLGDSQASMRTALGSDEYEDLIAQVTANSMLRMQEGLLQGRIDTIRDLINRAR